VSTQGKTRHFIWPSILLPAWDSVLEAEPFCLEGLEFDVWFLEGVRQAVPDSIECLLFLGNAYTALGLYLEGLEIDRHLARLRPRDPIVHYNLACSYSLLGQKTEAVRSLERAVEFGYSDVDYMEADEDLANVRNDERYKALAARLRGFRTEFA